MDAGPGQHLRRARDEATLSIEEVAARLHLDTRTVGNLEADNYDELPAPTFVRGYLRSYARLLDIPPAPIIDGFDRRGLEPPPLVADIATSEEAKSTDMPMLAATLVIVVVLLGGVIIWWQSQFGASWPGVDATPEVAVVEGDNPIPQLRLDTDLQVRLPALREQGASGTTDSTGVVQLGDVDSGASVSATESDSKIDATDGTGQLAEEPQPEQATGPDNLAQVPGVGHLVLRVRRDSWIEVYDRDGERLYYSTARGGDSIELRAAEPLKVLLGFARGVQVEYNGRPYDPAPHTARGLARFSLGG